VVNYSFVTAVINTQCGYRHTRRRHHRDYTVEFPAECSRGARRWAWKQLFICQPLNATASTCDNLVWLRRALRSHPAPRRVRFCTATAHRAPVCACAVRKFTTGFPIWRNPPDGTKNLFTHLLEKRCSFWRCSFNKQTSSKKKINTADDYFAALCYKPPPIRRTKRSFVTAAASSSTAPVHHRDGVCSGCGVAWRPHHCASPHRCASQPAAPPHGRRRECHQVV
jgi:hypothetical protein